MESLALIGCAVTTGVGAVLNTAKVEPGSTVAVIGCGGVGLNVIQGAARSRASKIIAVDLLDNKLEYAASFGATHTVNGSKGDAVEQVRDADGRRRRLRLRGDRQRQDRRAGDPDDPPGRYGVIVGMAPQHQTAGSIRCCSSRRRRG